MKNLKNLLATALVLGALSLSSCLHIIEEATFRNNGSGNYKMTLDMSELKGMMDMFKGMGGDRLADSTAILGDGDYTPISEDVSVQDPMGGLGDQMSSVASTIKGVQGISNIVEIKDTSNFQFGYSFDFADMAALNRALKIINKDKYESKVDEVFRFNGKSFERLAAGDIGNEMKKAMMDSEGEGDGNMGMVKMFLADMSYKQVYHFPDRTVKKSDNKMGEITDNGHTLTINLKPFDEEQQKKKVSIATKAKLK
jgi:hypothetical protein